MKLSIAIAAGRNLAIVFLYFHFVRGGIKKKLCALKTDKNVCVETLDIDVTLPVGIPVWFNYLKRRSTP